MEALLSFLKKIIPRPVLSLFTPTYHFLLAMLAALRYGFPSRYLTVIGVTGTNGKTTVVHLLHEIFTSAGYRVGSLSSLRFKINDEEQPNLLKMTMPGRLRLQKFLSDCREAGCRFVILEVTSQGIQQFRHRFIRFQAAVLTNISPEHIEAHGGFENYRAAKMKLFQGLARSGLAVLNREDQSSELIARNTPAQIVWYSRSSIEFKRVGHPVRVMMAEPQRIRLEIDNVFLQTALGGMFNIMNILAAGACAMALNVSLSAIDQALGQIGVIPGRLEFIQNSPFQVVVDYAVTPDALEKVYTALGKELVCVFGSAGGGRDKWKRPELGKIAARHCREIILTSDDPDDENPLQIMEEIERGFSSNSKSQILPISQSDIEDPRSAKPIGTNYKKIVDRREAIRTALGDARPGDTVIITGMGAQSWFIVKGKKIPWDDRHVVSEELEKLAGPINE